MASKLLTVSLPEAMIWKVGQINQRTGIAKSKLVSQALLILFADYASFKFPSGEIGQDFELEDIEEEYASREE